MDVVLILDISGSVQEKYDNAMMFAGNVTLGLDIDSGNVRVGAVAYSSSPLAEFYLRDYNRRESVLHALRFYNPGGSTNTASALDEVRNTHFTASYGARSGVKKVQAHSCLKRYLFVTFYTVPKSLILSFSIYSPNINRFSQFFY